MILRASLPNSLASGEDSTVLSPERSVSPQQGHLDLLVIEKGEKYRSQRSHGEYLKGTQRLTIDD